MVARTSFAALAALVGSMGSAVAGGWPERPVRIIYPYAAGSAGDATARLIAHRLSDGFGRPFVVENRVGANGAIAAEAVARSAPPAEFSAMISADVELWARAVKIAGLQAE
jgi:tripartite-type tricarboxylate transporter receptor subunit TctC